MTGIDCISIIVYAALFCGNTFLGEFEMKISKLISAVLAAAMLLTMIPAAAVAQERDEVITAIHYYGDANFNDCVNTFDATILLKICADIVDPSLDQMTMTYELVRKIDANKDGRINTMDATFVLQVTAGMRAANEYYETASGNPPTPTAAPTTEPTEQPTDLPTTQPTGIPTGVPTAEPTAEPTATPDAYISVKGHDTFNEIDVECEMGVYEGENVITAENITLPERYHANDADLNIVVNVEDGVADPAFIELDVTPWAYDNENHFYKVIYNITGFNKINDDLTGNYALGCDIDLGGENRLPFGADWEDETQPDQIFEGIFHGGNHIISGLCIDHEGYYNEEEEVYEEYENIGLFAQNAGIIASVIVFTQNPTEDSEYFGVYGDTHVGVLAGQNGGVIQDCYVFGNVGALDFLDDENGGGAGGICGANYGIVTRCSFEGGSEGYHWIGGIVGKNAGKISESYFAGSINAEAYVSAVIDNDIKYIGGICGGSEYGDIRNCYVYCASTFVGNRAVGGMIGWLKGGHFHDSFVVNTRVDFFTEGGGHDDIGVIIDMPYFSGLYVSDNESFSLPAQYNHNIWDTNGASHITFPDLVNHRRFDKFYID